jgi:hypothetical protein
MTDDDLTPFADEPVFAALTGPATSDELAGEAEMLAVFRSAVSKRPRRRLAARLGAGGTVFVASTVALSGGVAAAAYSGSFPTSIQSSLHTVASWAGVPAPTHHHPRHHPQTAGGGATPVVTGSTGTSSGLVGSPAPSTQPTASPSSGQGLTGSKRRGSPSPGASPSANPSTSPSVSPTPNPTPSLTPTPTPIVVAPVPASLAVQVSATRVSPNTPLTLSGQLVTASGASVPNHRVSAYQRLTGGGKLQRIGVGTTNDTGDVSFGIPSVTHDVRLLLRAGHGVHSVTVTVSEIPTASVAVTPDGPNDHISISTNGAQPGDTIALLRRAGGQWVPAGAGQLGASGAMSLDVPAPATRPARYRLVLKATSAHAAVTVHFTVPPAT